MKRGGVEEEVFKRNFSVQCQFTVTKGGVFIKAGVFIRMFTVVHFEVT